MSKKMDIYAELDSFIEENEGQVTLTDVAKHFSGYGYQYAVDKACEWLKSHLGAPEGMPQAKSYNDAMNELIAEFRKGMGSDYV